MIAATGANSLLPKIRQGEVCRADKGIHGIGARVPTNSSNNQSKVTMISTLLASYRLTGAGARSRKDPAVRVRVRINEGGN